VLAIGGQLVAKGGSNSRQKVLAATTQPGSTGVGQQ